MPFYGDLRTFTLEDLLRWASANQKTGVLELERNAICRRIEFRKGWVGSCSSNDPATLLGQFLLSRGRVDETQLHHLLTLREVSGKRVGVLLIEMGLLTRAELSTEVAAKAEETIYGLFDWDDAFFRWDDGATLDPDQIEVNLNVEELIAEGRKRVDKLTKIREVFEGPGVVLEQTGVEIPTEFRDRPMSQRMFDSIDGQRTIAEILLHTRASEFLVLQFLYGLHQRGLVRVREVRRICSERPTLFDDCGVSGAGSVRLDGSVHDMIDLQRAVSEIGPPAPLDGDAGLIENMETANRLIDKREYEAAVELLRVICRDHSNDYSRRLLMRAENAFVNMLKQSDEVSQKIPMLLCERQRLVEHDASPAESFLASLVDGITDVKSILWISPLREVDVLIALRRMERKGMIELVEPDPEGAVSRQERSSGRPLTSDP